MKLKAKLLLVTSIALLLAASITPAFATVDGAPALIDYQGRVLDANGLPFASTAPVNYEIEFRIWDAQEAGTVQWAEKQVVTVDNGNFSVRLGEGTAFGGIARPALLELFGTNKNRYLGVTVIIPNQTPGEIAPRLAFLTSPFAFVAEQAKLADRATIATAAEALTSNAALQSNNPISVAKDDANQSPAHVVLKGAAGGTGNENEQLWLGVNTNGNGYGSIQSFRLTSGPTSLVLNPGGGGVGIGTTSPAWALDVNGTLGVRADLHAYSQIQMENWNDILLSGNDNIYHGLGFYNTPKLFAGTSVGGPVLYGFYGGALGSRQFGNVEKIALNWNQNGDVGAYGHFSMVNNGDIYLSPGSAFDGLGNYGGSTGKFFAGQTGWGPVLYGAQGGALGKRSGGVESVVFRWDAFDVFVSRNAYGNAFVTNSDARLKNSIAALDRQATLKKVLALEGKSYKLNGSDETQIGFVAQDVEKLFPEFVVTKGDGMKGVNYSQMVAPLAEAIKAQQQTIEALQKQNAKLEERLKAIETKLNK